MPCETQCHQCCQRLLGEGLCWHPFQLPPVHPAAPLCVRDCLSLVDKVCSTPVAIHSFRQGSDAKHLDGLWTLIYVTERANVVLFDNLNAIHPRSDDFRPEDVDRRFPVNSPSWQICASTSPQQPLSQSLQLQFLLCSVASP